MVALGERCCCLVVARNDGDSANWPAPLTKVLLAARESPSLEAITMAGRIRTLKPEWLEDEKLGSAGDAARVLSAGLVLLADDYGNGRASAAFIAAHVWTCDMEREPRETLAKASRALRDLTEMGFLTVYEVRGERYFSIRNWEKHQRVDKPGKPRVPGIPEGFANVSRESRECPAPDLRPPTDDTDHDHRPSLAQSDAPKAPAPPAVLSPLCAFLTSTWPDIKAPWLHEDDWKAAYPAVDLLAEARKARAWETAEPSRRKVRHGKFVTAWWARCQDGQKPGSQRVFRTPQTIPAYPASAFGESGDEPFGSKS